MSASPTSPTLELLEAHAAARGVPTERRTIAVVGGYDLGVSIGARERVEVLSRDGRLAVLATSRAAAQRCLELIDELSIARPARRERVMEVRAALAALVARWHALYEAFPHAALDELRTREPRARALLGLACVTAEASPHVMPAATTCEPSREPFVWSDTSARFTRAPGIPLAAAPVPSRGEGVLSYCEPGCDPGCCEVLSLVEVVDCDPGCL